MNALTLSQNPAFYGQKYDPFIIGFDRMLQQLESINNPKTQQKTNYPPYNIRYHKESDTYTIDIAIAGFSKENIDIKYEDNKLTVIGKQSEETDEEFIHKGISNRDFTRVFTLADTVVVNGAGVNNGMLSIYLENIIPEHKKPKQILIS